MIGESQAFAFNSLAPRWISLDSELDSCAITVHIYDGRTPRFVYVC